MSEVKCPGCAALWDFQSMTVDLVAMAVEGKVQVTWNEKKGIEQMFCACGSVANHPLQHTHKEARVSDITAALVGPEGHIWVDTRTVWPFRNSVKKVANVSPNFVAVPTSEKRIQLSRVQQLLRGGAHAIELCCLPSLMRLSLRCEDVMGLVPSRFLHKLVSPTQEYNEDVMHISIPSLGMLDEPFFIWNRVGDVKLRIMDRFVALRINYDEVGLIWDGLKLDNSALTLRSSFADTPLKSSWNMPECVELAVHLCVPTTKGKRKRKTLPYELDLVIEDVPLCPFPEMDLRFLSKMWK